MAAVPFFLLTWMGAMASTRMASDNNARNWRLRCQEDNARYENKITNIRSEMQRDLKAKDEQHQTALEKIRSDMQRDLKAKDEQHQTALEKIRSDMQRALKENANYKNEITQIRSEIQRVLGENANYKNEIMFLNDHVRNMQRDLKAKDEQHQTALEKIRNDLQRVLEENANYKNEITQIRSEMQRVLGENAMYKNAINRLEEKMILMEEKLNKMERENQWLWSRVENQEIELNKNKMEKCALRMLCNIRDPRVSTQMTRNQISELETLIQSFLEWLRSNSDATEAECKERFDEFKKDFVAIDASPTFSEMSSLSPSGVTTFQPDGAACE